MLGICFYDIYLKITFYRLITPVSEIAASNGHKNVVEFLASNGANIDNKNKDGSTALMLGIYFLRHLIYITVITRLVLR